MKTNKQIWASQIRDIDHLLEVMKELPKIPQTTKTDTGKTVRVAIKVEKIFDLDPHEIQKIQEYLDQENCDIAWDWKFGITNEDMLFENLLIKN